MESQEIVRTIVKMAKERQETYFETRFTGIGMQLDVLLDLLRAVGADDAIREVQEHRASLPPA